MISGVLRRTFGSANDRVVKRLRKKATKINAYEKKIQLLSDAELKEQTVLFKKRLADGESLDSLLVEAFATVREVSVRVLGMRHFDVQLVGGMVLHKGEIAEMRTGEGKTLMATLVAYLNALEGKGVHIVTVNDYLAKRDAKWMGQIYHFLGLTIGVIVPELDDAQRKEAYACDITYGTNNEFGFDYLRDNLKMSAEQMVQRDFHFAIVDEVDSILIDEARTPLIISGPADDSSELYNTVDKIIPQLDEVDWEKDEKSRNILLTDEGVDHVQHLLREQTDLLTGEGGLYELQNISVLHHVNQGLKAHGLFTRDVDYIVKDNKVIIIDEFTGRMMDGRRYSDGLHQALEAKENVEIQNENQTLASITFQNYFRMYKKLSGMTGTALTEAAEFAEIYNLNVVDIPPNRPIVRKDNDDEIYQTSADRDSAVIERIKTCIERQQPVLVGTASIERSEELSNKLKKAKVKHSVLNARQHDSEAQVIADAGSLGAVTIATNMAGRGTDIQLGGNLDIALERALEPLKTNDEKVKKREEIKAEFKKKKQQVIEAGGLCVIGTERHESRRTDNQLRGRSGRQGDAGESTFYVSLSDDLMRIFGSERLEKVLKRLGLEKGEAISHPWVSKALEKAQKKVEARNFEIRKQLLRFDDVMNDQRKAIFSQRREVMEGGDIAELVQEMRDELVMNVVDEMMPPSTLPDRWNVEGLHESCLRLFGLNFPIEQWVEEESVANNEVQERILNALNEKMAEKEALIDSENMRMLECNMLVQLIDHHWKEHLVQLEYLRQGIGLRAYGQRDPLNEYKKEAFGLFESMLANIRENLVQMLALVELQEGSPEDEIRSQQRVKEEEAEIAAHHAQSNEAILTQSQKNKAGRVMDTLDELPSGWIIHKETGRALNPNDMTTWGKIPRNASCPCGSGKKYKHCHGAI